MRVGTAVLAVCTLPLTARNTPSLERIRRFDAARNKWQKPAELLAALKVNPGATVADIGAGAGYFVTHLPWGERPRAGARRRAGVVALLKRRAAEDGWRNVDIACSSPADPLIGETSMDAVAILLTSVSATALRPTWTAPRAGPRYR